MDGKLNRSNKKFLKKKHNGEGLDLAVASWGLGMPPWPKQREGWWLGWEDWTRGYKSPGGGWWWTGSVGNGQTFKIMNRPSHHKTVSSKQVLANPILKE